MSAFLRRAAALLLFSASVHAQEPPAATPAPAAASEPAAAPESAPAAGQTSSEQLEGVEVHGKRDAMSKSDEKLRKLRDSLPDLGDGGKPKDNLGQKVREKIVNTVKNDDDPNKRSTEGKQFMNQVLDPLNAHAGDAPATQEAEDFKDQYCGTAECAKH